MWPELRRSNTEPPVIGFRFQPKPVNSDEPSKIPTGVAEPAKSGNLQHVKDERAGGTKWRKKERTYWRNNFFVVLLPFVLIGLPVHVLLHPKKRTQEQESGATGELDMSWRHWFKSRFSSPFAVAVNVILFPFWAYINFYFLSSIIHLINDVIVRGRLRQSDITAFFQAVYSVPFVLITNYVWFYGHLVCNIIESFDTPTSVVEVSTSGNKPATEFPWVTGQQSINFTGYGELLEVPQVQIVEIAVEARSRDKYYRKTLARVYFVILAAHLIHFFVVRHRAEHEEWVAEDVFAHILTYIKSIAYTLILPVYMTCCGAISCQINALAGFMKRCIQRGERMRRAHIYLIKSAYKRIADSIVTTNCIFGLYLTLVMYVLDISVAVNSKDLVTFIVSRITNSLSGDASSPGTRNETLGLERSFEGDLGSDDFGIPADVVRYMVGVGTEAGLYFYLVWMVFAEAIFTNDKARHLHVWVNDFATEMGGKEEGGKAGARSPADENIYREFRMLKFYMHSRMEAQAERHRALLNIRGAGLIMTLIPDRLVQYRLNH